MEDDEEEEEDPIEQLMELITENVAPISLVTGVIALAPPALPMFPPLGAPQPGGVGVGGGGGSLPSAALAAVRKYLILIENISSRDFISKTNCKPISLGLIV